MVTYLGSVALTGIPQNCPLQVASIIKNLTTYGVSKTPKTANATEPSQAIIVTDRLLSLTMIAEGAEANAQVDFLRERACGEFQDFYFSKAVMSDTFAKLLKAQMTSMPAAA